MVPEKLQEVLCGSSRVLLLEVQSVGHQPGHHLGACCKADPHAHLRTTLRIRSPTNCTSIRRNNHLKDCFTGFEYGRLTAALLMSHTTSANPLTFLTLGSI